MLHDYEMFLFVKHMHIVLWAINFYYGGYKWCAGSKFVTTYWLKALSYMGIGVNLSKITSS